MSSESMSSYFSQPRGTFGQSQTDGLSSTQLKFAQMQGVQGTSTGNGNTATAGVSQNGTPSPLGIGMPMSNGLPSGNGVPMSTLMPSAQQKQIVMPATMQPENQTSVQAPQAILPATETTKAPAQATTFTEELQQLLTQNTGEYAVAECLAGENNLVKKQGTIYSVSDNSLVLYDDTSKSYTVCDLSSIQFCNLYPSSQVSPKM